jgi:FtsP/CotA-like multicopper oxidase with cupredoxin domain
VRHLNKRVKVSIIIFALLGVLVVAILTTYSRDASPSNNFSRTIDGLSSATNSEMVELNDGDTFNIVAKPVVQIINGQDVRMLSYNGSIPGPTIIATEGDKITLNIKNELDVDTTIHPHGINGSSANDGVPDVSQAPIGVGESYNQTIEFPEPGLFWYHPHVREDYTQASGMYANFIVRPKDPDNWPKADREHVLQLSDILLTDEGLEEFSKDEVTHTLMGRFGNVQLVNGLTDYVIEANVGEVQRLYLTNTSSVRSFRFEIPDVKLKLVGGDNGFYEKDSMVSNVVIAPSERIVVDVLFDSTGEYEIRNNNPESNTKLASIVVSGGSGITTTAKSFNVQDTRESVTKEIEELLAAAESRGIKKRLTTKADMNPIFMQGMMDEMMRAEQSEDGEDHEGIEWEDAMPEANAIKQRKHRLESG